MFLLMRYLFRKVYHRSKERNICILGLDYAGKSSFLNNLRYHFNLVSVSSTEMVPTIGLNFSKIEYKNFSFTLWDVGGQKKFRDIWESYFADIDALVWVIDCSDKSRFEENVKEFEKLMKDERLVYVPVCILANKQDKSDAIDDSEVSKLLKLEEFNSNRKFLVIKTCFVGELEKQFGYEQVLNWISETLSNDDSSLQRHEWRKSQKPQT